MTRQKYGLLFCVTLMLASFIATYAPTKAYAQSVSINPKRVVFSARDRTKEIYLMNSSDEDATYRILFQEMIMDETGSVKIIKGDDIPENHTPSSKMIRYSPRQVVIPAHGSQVVMLMARKPKDLADGEYRSHALFQAVPKEGGESLEDIVLKKGEVGVKITPIFGISIPVIVRHGTLTATAKMSDAKIVTADDGRKSISLVMHRTGNRSLYGDFTALYTPPNSKKSIPVGRIKGVGVYTDIKARPIKFTLAPPDDVKLRKGGKISIKFEEEIEMGGDLTDEINFTIK